MSDLTLTLATTGYDHFRAFRLATVQDLKGKTVGSPEWAHSAAVYMRGWMHNEMGVPRTA